MKTKQQPTDYRRFSDEELVYRYVHRQEVAAVYQLFDRYGHLVLGIALKHTAAATAARDKTQHLFTSLLTNLSGFSKGLFKDWLLEYTRASLTGKPFSTTNTDPLADLFQQETHFAASFEEARATSACIGRRQLQQYLERTLTDEETSAMQQHIAQCACCTEAMRGVAQHEAATLMSLENWNHAFLKDQYALLHPQLHQNSMALHAAQPGIQAKKAAGKLKSRNSKLRGAFFATAITAGFALLWYWQYGQTSHDVLAPTPEEPSVIHLPPSSIVTEDYQPKDEIVPAPTADPSPSIIQNAAIKEVAAAPQEPKQVKPEIIKSTRADGEGVASSETHTTNTDKTSSVKETARLEPVVVADGYQLYEEGKFAQALVAFKVDMKTADDPKAKYGAALMAARCYLNMGREAKAKPLLELVVSEASGSQKRQARRLLRRLEGATGDE